MYYTDHLIAEQIYPDLIAENEKYIVIGQHGENPGCYPYLDRVICIEKATNKNVTVLLHKYLSHGREKYGKETKLSLLTTYGWRTGDFLVGSELNGVCLHCNMVFAPYTEVGETRLPAFDKTRLATYFDYEIAADDDVIFRLKPGVQRVELMRFPGFTNKYDVYKLSGGILSGKGQSYLYMVDTARDTCDRYDYGGSTTCCSNAIWDLKKQLVDCAKEMFPNLSKFRELSYVTEFSDKDC